MRGEAERIAMVGIEVESEFEWHEEMLVVMRKTAARWEKQAEWNGFVSLLVVAFEIVVAA